jgi:hypothetical protein
MAATVTRISWVDCNDHGQGHRWVFSHSTVETVWFQCQDCPVTSPVSRKVLMQASRPPSFLHR